MLNNKRNGLTISLVFEAESANYGEGIGNISTLKRLSRDGGRGYSYISRQALRYNLINQLNWDNTPITSDNTVVQFSPNTTIKDYPEIDLFGYMKTEKNKSANTRSAVARLSNAVSLEPFQMDMDFLTNMGLAKRDDKDNAIAQIEIHRSFYAYTLTVDLDRVGVDKDIELDTAEKIKRVELLLDGIQYLYRDIRGRRENLSPIFVIGGVYQRKNPFFENRIKLYHGNLNIETLLSAKELAGEHTQVGYLAGSFVNDKAIKERLEPQSIAEFFKELKAEVEKAYKEEA